MVMTMMHLYSTSSHDVSSVGPTCSIVNGWTVGVAARGRDSQCHTPASSPSILPSLRENSPIPGPRSVLACDNQPHDGSSGSGSGSLAANRSLASNKPSVC